MSNFCTIDIETLCTEDPEVIAEIAERITPPGNISKAETLQAWADTKKPALVMEAVSKTAFDGTYGRILCIGWAVGDGEPNEIIGGVEKYVLDAFMENLAVQHLDKDTIFVGHNIHSFDLRFIWQRCVINGVKMNPVLKAACKAKAWDRQIGDTLLLWNSDRDKRISLDRLCKVLGVKTSKGDMDGSKVYETYLAGDLQKIADYCGEDVRATRECYLRLVGV
jgi:DNA polymerase elongation subunit (family B)